jgi:hypothetical protein
MGRIEVPFPLGGLVENAPLSEQAVGTSSKMRNTRTRDPVSNRLRGAQRAGTRRYIDVPLAGAPVRRIQQVSFDAPNQTYGDLGPSSLVVEDSEALPGKGDAFGVVIGHQGDRYLIDNGNGIAKLNSSGFQLWKITLPTEDKAHIVEALCVDGDTDIVYAGVSARGKQSTARLFAYQQEDDNQTEKLWQIEPGGYCIQLRIYNNELYALLNFVDQGKAYIYNYTSITAGQDSTGAGGPELSKQWEVMYPASDFFISPKDGSVFVASDANSQRGLNPSVSGSTTTSQNWTPHDLTDAKKRIWSWHDASDRDSLDISPISVNSSTGTASDEGGEIIRWRSKAGFGDGRDWYANHQLTTFLAVPEGEAGPRYRAAGIGGLPSLSFSGAAYNGSNAGNIAGETMASDTPSSSDRGSRFEQKTTLPIYKGAQFCLVMIVKAAVDDVKRGLLGITTDSDASLTRGISCGIDDGVSIAIPGCVRVRDAGAVASTGGTTSPAADGPSGPAGINPGAMGASGITIITWINDGGVHDGNTENAHSGYSSRSILRVNGQPCDRWQSSPFFASLPIMLGLEYLGSSGFSRFSGMIGEMICLSDWYTQDGVQQRLVTCPGYPDDAFNASNPNLAVYGDSEVERLEGYLAHKWGAANELVTGQANFLNFTGTPIVGDTVTIDGVTYTFKNVLTTARDVAIGGGQRQAMTNLFQAINRIGNPGTDYEATTQRHPTFMATAGIPAGGTAKVVGIRSRSPYQAQAACSETSANLVWFSATTFLTRAGSGSYGGYYPHPFALQKTSNSMGGPPGTGTEGTNTLVTISPYLLTQSVYPACAKYEAATGKLVWVATSGFDVTASTISNQVVTTGTGIGGVGYGVAVSSDGEVFSTGPKQAAVASPTIISVNAKDIRKFGDTGTAFTIVAAAEGDPWSAQMFATDSFTQAVQRLDVDAFDNVYAPVFYSGADVNYQNCRLVAYRKASTGSAVGVEFIRYLNNAIGNAYAAAVDPNKPSFPVGDTIQHGEFVYLAAVQSGSTHISSWKLRELSTANTSGSVRSTHVLAVCAGQVFKVVKGGAATLATGVIMDTLTSWIDSCYLLGKAYFVDGRKCFVYDPTTTTLAALTSQSSGQVPLRCKLIASWNGRLVLARPADNAQQWFMSKQGDPLNWDVAPPTITEAESVIGADSRTNLPPGPITALISLSDDLLLVGQDGAILRMTGDPMAGGMFHPISNETGIAFGQAWCRDPDGNWYFFGDSGGVFRGDGQGQSIVRISLNKLERRLATVDFTQYRIELEWSYAEDGLKVVQVPIGTGGVPVVGWFWERQTDSWTEETYGITGQTGRQITCMYALNGDDPDDRVLLYGCEDGRLRFHDQTAKDDDGQAIDSFALIGPISPGTTEEEMLFTNFELVTAREQNGPNWFLYAGETADMATHPFAHGRAVQGRAGRNLARVRAAFVWYGIGLNEIGGRWAFESLACSAEPMGIKRSAVLACIALAVGWLALRFLL